ncbi:MAG TPA: methionine synthase [Methylomusa anaerophila]|uniref:Vitamin B12 dependent methionine synthase, activation domain n=1 Tax=Methylomusa anaerophila TaxID=1930071 RepID=A0A348AHN5_9FIRM|nr:methionine synthase [Methylomusa anaerophila]BBB90583.1 vitamin B12 dependent methionine synthase, activation domain [Methylomusa anaerophila]HML88810.1 methionine synthase [Methylomusa anaerophila]
MPVFNPKLSHLDLEQIKRSAGIAAKETIPEQLLGDACAQALLLILPRASWNIYPYDQESNTILAPTPVRLPDESITRHLNGAAEVAVLAATIGELLENQVSVLLLKGLNTLGLLLDAAGTVGIEEVCNKTAYIISETAASYGYVAGRRFSPGHNDWDTRIQPDLLSIAEGSSIGIQLADNMMLIPHKSTIAIIGLYPNNLSLEIPTDHLGCDKSHQTECYARKESKKNDTAI